MFWVCICIVVAVVARRYKSPRYSTQRFSRRCDYMQKCQITPLKVPWCVTHKDYRPFGQISKVSPFWWFHLTQIDGCLRFLVEVSPYMFCRVPFNPFGRTGIIGKGLFPRFGPNHMIITIVWSRTFGFLKMVYLKKGKFLYRGYIDHPMNTDNAWVEADIYSLEIMSKEPLEEKETCEEWLKVFVQRVKDE